MHLPFTTSGSGWLIGGDETNDGIDPAGSQPPPDSGSAVLGTSVTGPGTLRFFWRVSSEENDDYLSVAIPSASVLLEISGDTSWQEIVLTNSPGDPSGSRSTVADLGSVARLRIWSGSFR